jgi:hypothetical protein
MRSDGGERKKERRKKKTKKNRLNQRTCMENWRIHRVSFRSHVARIEMLLTFHRSVYGRQLRLLMKDCRAYSRRHRWSRTPSPPLQTHSSCSREAWLQTAREIDLHAVEKACKGGGQTMEGCGSFLDVNLKKKW